MTDPAPIQEPGAHMSFLEHLDELRRRIVRSVVVLVIAFFIGYGFSDRIYHFLSIPVLNALAEAGPASDTTSETDGKPISGELSQLKVGDSGRYVFDRTLKVGNVVVPSGASVLSHVETGSDGQTALVSSEPIITNSGTLAAGFRLPVPFINGVASERAPADARLIVTTAQEQFTLYVTVSLYTALLIAMPFLLWQIWGFISPALYRHERAYVWPFVGLSSTAFVLGAATGYYVIFPPAANYLLGLGNGEFQLLLRASDYLDLITIILLAMGILFQMPAITYVLARIGIVNARFLIKQWKMAIIIILIVAAVASPTGDIPNMLLFASPMFILYIISIGIAWIFGKKRQTDAEAAS